MNVAEGVPRHSAGSTTQSEEPVTAPRDKSATVGVGVVHVFGRNPSIEVAFFDLADGWQLISADTNN
jgi:hypothetical protein